MTIKQIRLPPLGIISVVIVYFTVYNTWTDNLQNKTFQKYEVFSQKIMPPNFGLAETQRKPSTMSAPTQIEQTFRISSTRKEIREQLEPIFKRYGFRTIRVHLRLFGASGARKLRYKTQG